MNRYSRVHAEIDLDAILHNMDAMRGNIAKDTKIMAVIKAVIEERDALISSLRGENEKLKRDLESER